MRHPRLLLILNPSAYAAIDVVSGNGQCKADAKVEATKGRKDKDKVLG